LSIVKKAKSIILTIIVVISVGGLLFFASPAPETEKGIELLRYIYIVLAALAGIILLVILIKYIKAIIRSITGNLPSVIAAVAAGLLAYILFFFDWPAEIAMKIELLKSVLLASLALVGFVSIMLIELIHGNEDLTGKLGMSHSKIKKLKVQLCCSIAFGCSAILVIMVYFILFDINIIYVAWILFLLQLLLLILSLLFAKIMVLR